MDKINDERFDGILMTAVQQAQGLENFLAVLFGFLRRKTDFFSNPEEGERIVLKHFKVHQAIYERITADAKAKIEAEQKVKEEKMAEKAKIPKKEEPDTTGAKVEEITEEEAKVIESGPNVETYSYAEDEKEGEEAEEEEKKEVRLEKDDPEDDKGPVPIGNGGKTDRYIWTQTLKDLVMNIPVPENTKAKMIDYKMTSKHLKIGIKGQPPIIDGDFHKRVKMEDTFWNLEDAEEGRMLILSVEKFEGMNWWSCAIEGDLKINTRKIPGEDSKLGDLDNETRGTVEKMMFDQNQKMKGLPTSEEQAKQDKLKDFMKAHPEMDFSKAKFC